MTKPAMLGSAPDSWGVWYADDPVQTPWRRFLDEVSQAGYTRIELGPYGYLPTDPSQLREELDNRLADGFLQVAVAGVREAPPPSKKGRA